MSNEKKKEKKFCSHCGSEIENDSKFCSSCGNSVMEESQAKKETIKVYENRMTVNDLPNEFKPISMWGYFGYQLLFLIPCVGIILLLVFAFGGTPNVNVKNFARSYFCLLIVIVVLFFIIFGLSAISFGMFASRY